MKIAERFSAGIKYFCFSSPVGTKEAFCRPWRDLLEIVIENPAEDMVEF